MRNAIAQASSFARANPYGQTISEFVALAGGPNAPPVAWVGGASYDAGMRNALMSLAVAWVAAAAVGSDGSPARSRVTPVVKVFRTCKDAVVNISSTRVVTIRSSPFGFDSIFDEIFDHPLRRDVKTTGLGSGFVLHPSGYIVTNAHVVARTVERKVGLADGVSLDADIVAIDRAHDLAVLRVKPERPLDAIRLGRSSDLMIGETVVAIGNPLGYQHTVTSGVVSATGRELRFSRDVVYRNLIQTDASINPGNSGGPLLNIHGELIGINTAIRGDAQNIGFAIPVDDLKKLLPGILDVERIHRLRLGMGFSETDGGVRIARVDVGSPAAAAKVPVGATVAAINGRPTPTYIEAYAVLAACRPRQTITFRLVDADGQSRDYAVVAGTIPPPDGARLAARHFGLALRQSGEALEQMGLRPNTGLIIVGVEARSPAGHAGIRAGDILTQVGRHHVHDLDAVGQLLEEVRPGAKVYVGILRLSRQLLYQTGVVLTAR